MIQHARIPMRRVYIALAAAGAAFALQPTAAGQAPAPSRPLRIIAFGAHPDDAELKARASVDELKQMFPRIQ
jgi:hypothetical protein